MPSLSASQNIDRSQLHNDHRTSAVERPMPFAGATMGVSPLMGSSLPAIAAGTDLYGRQFYGNGRVPQRRFLPVGSL